MDKIFARKILGKSISLSLSLYAITTPTIELLSGGTCYRQRIKRTNRQREGGKVRKPDLFEQAWIGMGDFCASR